MLDIDSELEHGLLCDLGAIETGGVRLNVGELGYQGPGVSLLHLHNTGHQSARMLLLGGAPFTEQLLMWWNFVGRSHEDIVRYRQHGRRR